MPARAGRRVLLDSSSNFLSRVVPHLKAKIEPIFYGNMPGKRQGIEIVEQEAQASDRRGTHGAIEGEAVLSRYCLTATAFLNHQPIAQQNSYKFCRTLHFMQYFGRTRSCLRKAKPRFSLPVCKKESRSHPRFTQQGNLRNNHAKKFVSSFFVGGLADLAPGQRSPDGTKRNP